MSVNLFFPCCTSQSEKVQKTDCRKSAFHALTAIVVAIILGLGTALALHFFAHSNIMCTALAGTGVAVVSGILLYTILRCLQKKTETEGAPPSNKTTSQKTPEKNWEADIIRAVLEYPGDLKNEQKAQIITTSVEGKFEISFEKNSPFNFSIKQQNMLDSRAQVIVNAANVDLCGGGGIDGAIHDAGGSDYEKEHQTDLKSQYSNGYVEGHAAIIGSGMLSEKSIEKVIVVAGPQGKTSPEKENQLYSCYFNALVLAHTHGKNTIAFPSISTGLFGFDKGRAAAISLRAIYDFTHKYPQSPLKTISIHYLKPEELILESYEAAVKR